ncbi:unnamed protein product [Ceratitis capitata]|uniref:(Mediterranean fruit fly) hypothetical protein n=1 Tax=Ceratitis capitata TaxID=7213 RepID=A0A811V2H4_CERCA|nr:unnamed protein product [Ceratitis capitata]
MSVHMQLTQQLIAKLLNSRDQHTNPHKLTRICKYENLCTIEASLYLLHLRIVAAQSSMSVHRMCHNNLQLSCCGVAKCIVTASAIQLFVQQCEIVVGWQEAGTQDGRQEQQQQQPNGQSNKL